MRRLLLVATLTGALVLGACGNEEAEKTHENKTESVDKKNEAPKKSEDKKDTDKQDTSQETEDTQETSTNEPTAQETVEQPVTKEEPAPVEQQEEPNMPELDPEKNFDPHGGEIPNEGYSDEELKALEGGTDAGSTDKMEEFYQQERAKEKSSDEDIMGPGDPNYKPDPRFTEGPEGYDPVEGAKDPNKDDFTFK